MSIQKPHNSVKGSVHCMEHDQPLFKCDHAMDPLSAIRSINKRSVAYYRDNMNVRYVTPSSRMARNIVNYVEQV